MCVLYVRTYVCVMYAYICVRYIFYVCVIYAYIGSVPTPSATAYLGINLFFSLTPPVIIQMYVYTYV
jgi:hypothetical protein